MNERDCSLSGESLVFKGALMDCHVFEEGLHGDTIAFSMSVVEVVLLLEVLVNFIELALGDIIGLYHATEGNELSENKFAIAVGVGCVPVFVQAGHLGGGELWLSHASGLYGVI